MKIKSDFVTNSSSSSFIVFFPKVINTIEDLSEFIKRKDFQKIIFEDIKNQQALKVSSGSKRVFKTVVETITSGYVSEVDMWNYDKTFCAENGITRQELRENPQWLAQMYNEQEILRTQISQEIAANLLIKHKGEYVYIFHYSDEDDGIFSALEHENNWGGLPYKAVSHH